MSKPYDFIAAGKTAQILHYDDMHVLKWFKPGIREGQAEEEFRIGSIVYRTGIACPEPVKLLLHDGRPGILYRRIEGATMMQRISARPWTVRAEAARLARIHADIHGRPVTGLPLQKQIMRTAIDKAPLLTVEEKKAVTDCLDRLPDGRALCHGDLHPDNVMIGDKVWAIDWMTGMQGNPAGDAARTILILQLGDLPEELPRPVKMLITAIRRSFVTRYSRQYIRASGISYDDIDGWLLPVAAARLVERLNPAELQRTAALVRERLGAHR